MQGLARVAMRGPLPAIFLIASFALLALPFGPALLVSGALLGLVTLRHGATAGLQALAGAGVLAAVAVYGLTGRLGPAAVTVVASWIPVWVAAAVLRRTGSQGRALAGLGFWVVGFALAMRVRYPDVRGFWRERLSALTAMVEAEGGKFLTPEQVELYGNLMHGASVALIYLVLASMLLLARAWQAGLYNPGGFRSEFHALRLPGWISPVGAMVALASLALSVAERAGGLADDAIIVLLLMFAVQGLAVVHAVADAKALTRLWLVGLYILMILVPQLVMPLLATAGIADRIVDFRRRMGRPGQA